MWWKALASIVFFAGFVAVAILFSGDATVEEYTYAPSLDGPDAGSVPSNTTLSVADQEFVCRAALSQMTGHDFSIISAKVDAAGMVRTEYTKPEDGSVWRTACRIDEARIIWAYLFDDGSLGRWRLGAEDEVITFELGDEAVTITRALADQEPVIGQVSRGSD